MSPTGKSQWSLHACDPVTAVETENSPPRAGVPLGSEAVKSLKVVEMS